MSRVFLGAFSTKWADSSRENIEIINPNHPNPHAAPQMHLKLRCDVTQIGQAIWEVFDAISNNWVPQPGVPPYDVFQLGPLDQQHPLPLVVGIHTFYSANWNHRLLFQISDQHPETVFRYQPKNKMVNGVMITPDAINFRCLHLIQQVQTAVQADHIMHKAGHRCRSIRVTCGYTYRNTCR